MSKIKWKSILIGILTIGLGVVTGNAMIVSSGVVTTSSVVAPFLDEE